MNQSHIASLLLLALSAASVGTGGAQTPPPGSPPRYERTAVDYQVPDVTLTDQDGHAIPMQTLLDGADPVAMSFVFTTCTTICPVITATLVRMQQELGADATGLQMVAVSIDPSHDTPEVLHDYAGRFAAGPGWRFLTGTPEAVNAVLRAFGTLSANKTAHRPLVLLRPRPRAPWIRIQGLASAVDLATEYRAGRTPTQP